MKPFTFTTSKCLINESGALKRIAEICRSQGIKRPLIVSDPGIQQLGMLQQLENYLHAAGVPSASYAKVVADPPEEVVMSALQMAVEQGADGVIGFGGGSSMDTAKLVALMAGSGETLADIYGVNQARGRRLPLILIPTTAGTGSEVTAVAIVTTGATTKMGVVAPQLLPDVALLDAELTLGLPPASTAMTGVDAMVHAVEAYTSAYLKNPYSDMLAREALKLLADNIYTAAHKGTDLAARQNMLFGACLAGQAFANAPVAAVHALAYPLGGHYHIPHGLSNSLVLPHVLRFNAQAADVSYGELVALLDPDSRYAGRHQYYGEHLADYFTALIQQLELPSSLSAMKIPSADLPALAADAMLQERLLVNNPRPVLEADALAIYQNAF